MVIQEMQLVEHQEQGRMVGADVDAVHLSPIAAFVRPGARDAVGRAGVRPDAAIEPADRGGNGAPLGYWRCAANRHDRAKPPPTCPCPPDFGAALAPKTLTPADPPSRRS